MKTWIDTDAGLDDALAILMALKYTEVVGISCSYGNCSRDQVVINVTRILSAHCAQYNTLPPKIYLGAEHSLSKIQKKPTIISEKNEWHGYDGLGDVPNLEQHLNYKILDIKPSNNLVDDFVSLCQESNITLISIGPLTLANQLQKIAKFNLISMAGCFGVHQELQFKIPHLYDTGNMRCFGMPYTEHNVACDPEAALVLNNQNGSLIADWGLTIRTGLTQAMYQKLTKESKTITGKFYTEISKQYQQTLSKFGYELFLICDSLAVYLAIDNAKYSGIRRNIEVSLNDDETYGQTTCQEQGNTLIVTQIDYNDLIQKITGIWM
ncbi:Inosine-uridine_nucleoside N-ribohydrolase [Hexamita inflata]|uniref:Inosine-uridine nucleoside N-ribohydrolase n=1 Tax=Hexamita inflata TaxID=28002 RepID=A0AA86QVJ0_9EUKA|nr:Inosine-uridine nucleoside N-ribohydrolase [Hexamita inflata]